MFCCVMRGRLTCKQWPPLDLATAPGSITRALFNIFTQYFHYSLELSLIFIGSSAAAAAAAKSLQSCPTLCNPIDSSPPGSPSLGFSKQEHWSGLPFPSPMHESEKWKWSHSVVSGLLATPWTAAYQAPPTMGYSRQEYWSGVPLPSPRYRAVRWYKGKGTGFRAQSSEIKFKSIA